MRLIFASLVMLAMSLGGVARAQTASLPDGNVLTFGRLFLHENNSKDRHEPQKNPDSINHYFNRAHCICARPNVAKTRLPYYEDKFEQEVLISTNTSTVHQPMTMWVGSECDSTDIPTRTAMCHATTTAVSDVSTLANTNGTILPISIYDLMNPAPADLADESMSCAARVLSTNLYAVVDSDANGSPDYFVPDSVDTDSLPPPLPTSFTASGAENAIQISWKAATGDISDVYAYQALCAKDDGTAGRSQAADPLYYTPRTLCGDLDAAADIDLSSSSVSGSSTTVVVDAGVDAPDAPDADPNAPDAGIDAGVDAGPTTQVTIDNLPTGLRQLNKAFICGQNTSPTATNMRIDGLENNVPYTVVFLAIDKFGNAAGTFFTSKLTPQPVTDFWEDIHDKGDDVNGGFCLIAQTYGDDNPITTLLRSFRDKTLGDTPYGRWLTHAYYAYFAPLGQVVANHFILRILAAILLFPVVVFALLWHLLTLPGLVALLVILKLRRRWMSKRLLQLAPTAVALLVLGVSHSAHAQAPYWEDQNTGENTDQETSYLADQPSLVHWNAGLRGGPFTPGIDSQGGMKNSAGQGPYEAMFGNGFTIMPTLDVDRFLWTKFGQLGVGISVGYMGKTAHAYKDMTDPNDPMRPRSAGDETSFRMIPLAFTATYRLSFIDDEYGIPIVPYIRGGLAYYVWWMTAPDSSFSRAPTDHSNRAIGASAGLTGSVGIAIRAERIDANAARSMHESGLEHAGFFGEVSTAWVDGFGKSDKLSVGDTTWSAGINFEF